MFAILLHYRYRLSFSGRKKSNNIFSLQRTYLYNNIHIIINCYFVPITPSPLCVVQQASTNPSHTLSPARSNPPTLSNTHQQPTYITDISRNNCYCYNNNIAFMDQHWWMVQTII